MRLSTKEGRTPGIWMWLDHWRGIKRGNWAHASAVNCSVPGVKPTKIDQMDAAGLAFTLNAQGVPG